jgi:hypothetical protein
VSTTLRVKTDQGEFDQAEAGGEVYGELRNLRISGASPQVYIELGRERPYVQSDNDDPKAEYKFFINCYVEVYASQKSMNEGTYVATEDGVNIILYC